MISKACRLLPANVIFVGSWFILRPSLPNSVRALHLLLDQENRAHAIGRSKNPQGRAIAKTVGAATEKTDTRLFSLNFGFEIGLAHGVSCIKGVA